MLLSGLHTWRQLIRSRITRGNSRRRSRLRTTHPTALYNTEQLENRVLLSAYFSVGGSTPIPDQTTIVSTIDVPDSITIDDINVTVNIAHTRDQDIDIFLIAPNFTRVELFTDVGANGDNFTGTILDDEATGSITVGLAPFTGSFQPEGNLALFDGKPAQGTWSLEVTDDKRRETGTLDGWSIDVTPAGTILAVDDVSQVEGDSGTTAFVFTVTRSGDTSGTSSVAWTTVDGSATTADSDYIADSGILAFIEGQTSESITIQVNGDTKIEPDQTFTVKLSSPSNATIADGIGQGTITDDDAITTISFPDFSDSTGLTLVGDAAIANGNILRLTPATGGMEGAAWYTADQQFVSVDWETTFDFNLNETSGGATDGSDGFVFIIQNYAETYLAGGGGTLGYDNLPNSLAVEFYTYLNGGSTADPSESHISVHTNGTEANGWAEALSLGVYNTPSIIDDAATHSVKITYTPGTLTIFLDDMTTPVLNVAVDLANTLELDSGRAWLGFTATTGGGYENHDILNWNYRVLADTTTTIAVGDAEVVEGDSGTTNMVFTVSRSGDISGTTTVNWITFDGTATVANGDYAADLGQIEFIAKETEKTITVTVNGDTDIEAHETFSVSLSGALGATVVDGSGVGTILNNETSISINDVSVTEGDGSIQFIDAFVTAGSGGLNIPLGMIQGPDGNLYIASAEGDEVLRYDVTTGTFIDAFVSTADNGGLDRPRNMVFGPDGNLYVTSGRTDSILRYQGLAGESPGAFINAFVADDPATPEVDETGGLDAPYGLDFHSDGYLYVTGLESDNILRYDATTGAFDEEFVTAGSGGLDSPRTLEFAADGYLYVVSSQSDNILRYNGTSGAFIGEFVTAGSGGLDRPMEFTFGPDGNLYVASINTDGILRYQGLVGASPGTFIDAFVPTGSGGLDNPVGIRFDSDGNLHVVSAITNEVLRYGAASQAVFTVSLSSPSALPVTVNYSTNDGTAKDGVGEIEQDYTATSGSITFDPGVTTRTIIVATIDDAVEELTESFFVNLSAATGAVVLDNQGEATILDDDAAGIALDSVAPNTASPNDQLIVTITGSDFVDGTTVDFGTRVNVQSVTFVNSSHLNVLIKVHRRAATGSRDVTVTNPDNSSATCTGCFNVVVNSSSSATSAQTSGPVQSLNLSSGDETSTETPITQPTDPALLNVEPAWAEEEPDDKSPTEDDPAIIPKDQADLDSLSGDLDGSLQEELLAV